MEEKKRELILKAGEIYMRYGIKSMTMDEMAHQLGVSKKTLYQYVKDKNDLVEQCVQLQNEQENQAIMEIISSTENAIEQMLKVSRFIIKMLSNVHPSIFFDISKYHPSAMKMMDEHKDEFVCGCIQENLKNGIKQGLYRENINVEVIGGIYVGMIDMLFHQDRVNNFDLKPEEVYTEMFKYHIRGIASEIGLEYLVELKKNDDQLSKNV